jgi:hypothetical protein
VTELDRCRVAARSSPDGDRQAEDLRAVVLAASRFALPALASTSRDSNGDRIPDRWERKFDLSLAKNQAPRDQDKDGVRNLAEYREATNPRETDTDNDGTSDGTDTDPCDHSAIGDQTPPTSPVTP